MKQGSIVLRLALLSALVAGSAQAQKSEKTSERLELRNLQEQIYNTLRLPRPSGLAGDSKDTCTADGKDDDCKSTIVLKKVELPVPGSEPKVICVAETSNVSVTAKPAAGSTDVRSVNYELNNSIPAAIINPRFVGSYIHQDMGSQHVKSEVSSPNRMIIKTKRNKKGAEILFLPLIAWENNGVLELCAAIDPKIVNV